jgi:hypothetical protein
MYGGQGVIQIASDEDLAGYSPIANPFSLPGDFEVGFGMTPTEFADNASTMITAEQGRAILGRMGYSMPDAISTIENLNFQLQLNTPVLSPSEVQSFVLQARGLNGG